MALSRAAHCARAHEQPWGFGVQGLGFRVQSLGFRVYGGGALSLHDRAHIEGAAFFGTL